MLVVISCEPCCVGKTVDEVKVVITARNGRGQSVRMLHKILYLMAINNLVIVPKFL